MQPFRLKLFERAVLRSRFGRHPMEDIKAKILEYAMASKMLDRNATRECAKLAAVVKHYLWQKADSFVRERSTTPLLYTYSSDGTPLTTVHRYGLQAGGKRFRREGGALHEVLLERGFVKAYALGGALEGCALVGEPRPLDKGKAAWSVYTAAIEFHPLLREQGHEGILISHYAFDRALFDSLERKMRQRHEVFYASVAGKSRGQAELLRLTDWVLSTGCGNHDCQNALKWGCREFMEDPGALLKDLFIAIESVRNGYAALHDYLRLWLLKIVQFQKAPFDEDALGEFWRALGVEADMVQEVMRLNLCWSNGALLVSPECRGSPELMEDLAAVVLYLFRFRKFTESRWTTLGDSSRCLLCALAVGLEHFVDFVRKIPGVSDWHLGGFSRLSADIKRFIGIVGLGAFVPDSVLLLLLEDDRVAGQSGSWRPQSARNTLGWRTCPRRSGCG